MSLPVVTGAVLACPMGAVPGTLSVIPSAMVNMENKPAATIMDNKPLLNISPFGVCSSVLNPATALLTAAAFGVLTPGPCMPATPIPWAPGSPTVLIGNFPALNVDSKCTCLYGGVISISFGGAMTELIP